MMYHQWTSGCAGNEERNGRCTTCREPGGATVIVRFHVTASTELGSSRPVRVAIPDVPDVEEILSRPLPFWHRPHAKYEPSCRGAVPQWRVKWRLKQQRPRDGLK